MRKTADAVEQARREAELSLQRQAQAREQVIRPLQRRAAQNQFASIIAASLREGHGRGP